jgi:hypothetical protein
VNIPGSLKLFEACCSAGSGGSSSPPGGALRRAEEAAGPPRRTHQSGLAARCAKLSIEIPPLLRGGPRFQPRSSVGNVYGPGQNGSGEAGSSRSSARRSWRPAPEDPRRWR